MFLALFAVPVKGFNISLSFATASEATLSTSESYLPIDDATLSALQTVGKVIKESSIDETDYRIKTVVIDPGHGGHDPGCLGHNSREKHLALAIGKKVAAGLKLNFPGLNVIMTRDTDVFIPLHERAAIANHNNADLFISIHCNYMPGHSGTHGSETYVMGLHTAQHNLAVAKRENAAILLEENYEKNYDFDPNSAEGHIMLSMYQNAYLEQSILFADRVEARFDSDAGRKSRGVKQAGFVVLKETAMPSVLVEAGFLSNYKEEEFLKNEEGQQIMADAIVAAFAEYKIMVETGDFKTPPNIAPIAVATVKQAPETTPTKAVEKETPKVVAVKTENKPIQSTSKPAQTRADSPSQPMMEWEKKLVADKKDNAPLFTSPPVNTTPKSPTPIPAAAATTYPSNYDNPEVRRERKIIPMQGTPVPGNMNQITVKSPSVATNVPTQTVPYQTNNVLQDDQQNIRFAVQLAASPRPIDTNQAQWRNIGYTVEIVPENDLFKYQARNFNNYYEALEGKLQLQNKGFADAFIVVYKNGRKIPLEQAKKELGIH